MNHLVLPQPPPWMTIFTTLERKMQGFPTSLPTKLTSNGTPFIKKGEKMEREIEKTSEKKCRDGRNHSMGRSGMGGEAMGWKEGRELECKDEALEEVEWNQINTKHHHTINRAVYKQEDYWPAKRRTCLVMYPGKVLGLPTTNQPTSLHYLEIVQVCTI